MLVCEKCKAIHDGTFGSGRFCSKSCASSRAFSAESRRKKSVSNKGQVPWNKGSAATTEKICVTCNKKFYAYGYRDKKTCSKECKHHAPGRNGGYRPNSTRKIRSEYKGYWMDSGAERKFAELLDANNIDWIKNTEKYFTYKDVSGKVRRYYPDFYLPQYDYWVEIKGLLYANENDSLKLAAVGENIELQMHNAIQLPRCIVLVP